MGARRTDRSLTAEERELAARAYELARPVAVHHAKRWRSYDVDWQGEVAVRICRMITDYDPARSSLRTWAIQHAHFACKDAIRLTAQGNSESRVLSRRLRILSIDSEQPDGSGHTYAGSIEGPGPPSPFEAADAAHLLRGLPALLRALVWDSFVVGRPLREIAAEHGVSVKRASQARTEALNFLRAHRAGEMLA